jgi:GT2 family glycosyltransferase
VSGSTTWAFSSATRAGGQRLALSVVIACKNGEATLGRQLDALLSQQADRPWEVIVSDNGSSDGSRAGVEAYRSRFPHLRLVDSSDRPGLAHARNVGARVAVGDSIAFCDQDDEVAPGWVQAMIDALEAAPLVAGRLEHDHLNEPWAIAVRGRPQEAEPLRYEEEPHLQFVFGCTLGVQRDLHMEIGGFDESFTKGAEDADYCWRLQDRGYSLAFIPAAVTHYRLRHGLLSIYRQARDYGESETLLYARHRSRHLPPIPRPWRKAVRLWLGTGKALAMALVRGRAGLALALWAVGQRVGRTRGSVRNRVLFP